MLGSGILPALSSTVCQETFASKVLQEDFVNPSNFKPTLNMILWEERWWYFNLISILMESISVNYYRAVEPSAAGMDIEHYWLQSGSQDSCYWELGAIYQRTNDKYWNL